MQAQSLGGEDPLEEGMATYSHILAWRIPWTEEPGGLPSMGSQIGKLKALNATTPHPQQHDLIYTAEDQQNLPHGERMPWCLIDNPIPKRQASSRDN